MTSDIDFVITWVDGSDPEWLKDRARFLGEKNIDEARYRDWGLLKYWFRAIEANAPWVRKIHFVTYGHIPKWLDTSNPKLHIVKHEDFIDKKYLPTFNSCAIEVNLGKIRGLSEKFVYFNDDVFLSKKTSPETFFIGEKPVDYAPFGVPGANDYMHYCICVNNVTLMNKYFDKVKISKENLGKYLNIKYGLGNIKTLLSLPWKKITGFDETHSFSPMLKSTHNLLWCKEPETLLRISASKTRQQSDCNQYIFKYWNFCSGNFISRKKEIEVFKPLMDDKSLEKTIRRIKKPKTLAICINDSKGAKYNEAAVESIKDCFQKKYNKKSSFEK